MAKNNTKNQHRWAQKSLDEDPNERSDKLEFHGEVVDALPGTMFKVKLNESNAEVLCTLAGKIRQNRIRILPGDRVKVEVSVYDLTRGRISWRH